jgi:hypothetical protein
MIVWALIIFIVTLYLSVDAQTPCEGAVSTSEIDALYALYSATQERLGHAYAPYWNFNGWSGTNQADYVSLPCVTNNWHGVICGLSTSTEAPCTVQQLSLTVRSSDLSKPAEN